jgi:hypothetical protein
MITSPERYLKPIAYSGIEMYEECPLKWADQYILGNKPPARTTADRGTDMHLMLELFFKGMAPFPAADKALRPWQRFMEALSVKTHTAEGEVAVRADWSQCGYWDKDANYRGKYDLKIQDEPRILDLFDWKSGRVYPKHESQGLSYCAMEPGDYDTYRTHFAYLDAPTHVETREYPAAKIEAERAKISVRIEAIREAIFYPPKPGNQCRYCHKSYKLGGDCNAAR